MIRRLATSMKRNDATHAPLAGLMPPGEKPKGFPGRWIGRFIWDAGEAIPRHYHLMARRSFALDRLPAEALLRIAVCDRYRLYVNGIYVARGTARITRPQWMPYDCHDVTALLRPGTNTLAVLAHHYGCPNNYTTDLRAGLFVQLDMGFADDTCQTVASDAAWRVRAMQGYRRDTPLLNWYHGIANEILDASLDPPDWMAPAFDDSGWSTARVLVAEVNTLKWAHIEDSPWVCLEPRRVPPLRERRVPPARVALVAETIEAPLDAMSESDVSDRLADEPHVAPASAVVRDVESLIDGSGPARLYGGKTDAGETRSPLLILDFGRPLFGCPELTLTAPAGAVIDIAYANMLSGAGVAARPAREAGLHVGERLIAREGRQTWQLSDTRQFRFLQIVVRAATRPVRLEKVDMIALEYPVEATGTFACADRVLSRIWEAGVNTVYLHMEDTHVCDATRERRQYGLGQEIRGGVRAIYSAFGDRFLAAEALLATQRMQLPNGELCPYSGSDGTILGYPRMPYALSSFNSIRFPNAAWGYALAVRDHYMRFGEGRFIALHYPALERLAEFYETFAVYEGLLYNLPLINFIDWAEHELRGANFFLNAGYAAMLDAMAEMGVALNKPSGETEARRRRAAEIRDTLRRLHWVADRGLFADSHLDGRPSPIFSVLTNAYAVLLGVADAEQTQSIAREVFTTNAPLTQPTPLDIGFIAEGLIRAGAVDETLRMLVARFAPMVSDGDVPTVGECWIEAQSTAETVNFGHIHDSACGIIATLQEVVLGVSPTAPGYARCRLQPRLGGLSWVKGVAPTPHGAVRVSCDQTTPGQLTCDVGTPVELPTELVLPWRPGQSALQIDGRTIDDDIGMIEQDTVTRQWQRSIVLPAGGGRIMLRDGALPD